MTTNTPESLISNSPSDGVSKSHNAQSDVVQTDELNDRGDGPAGSTENQADEVPAWLRKKREKRAKGNAQSRGAAKASGSRKNAIEQTEGKPPWTQRFVRWLVSFVFLGYGFSLLFHSVLLILFSVYVLPKVLDDRFEINLYGEETEGIEEGLVDVIDTRLDMPRMKNEEMTTVELMPLPVANDAAPLSKTIQMAIAGALKGIEDGLAEGAVPLGGKIGKNAVTKGSFTAWTVPDDPQPGQPYKIYIQVNLPKKIRRYDRRDLSGYVIGTDGWTWPIGLYAGGTIIPEGRYFPRKYYGDFSPKRKRFSLDIPPAQEALVEDTIKVRSKLLNEEQTLKIVF